VSRKEGHILAAVGGLGIVGILVVVLIVVAIMSSCGEPRTTNTRQISGESARSEP
jgi:hypothetical protein